ncbi:hypothetical protein KY358_06510, partial [Candidatus Woesearchaeota archaeon]|nr:hypothetical protein [Candidatus Woesearchaeota archaeon]
IEKFNPDSFKKYIRYKGRLYTYEKNLFICRDKNNKKEIFRKEIGAKDIERIELSPTGNGILILSQETGPLEDNKERTKSLGLYDKKGKSIWYAEKVFSDSPYDCNDFYDSIRIRGDKLFGDARNSHYCEIDLATGNLLSKEFVK